MEFTEEDFQKILGMKSSHHHYLPKFLIKGFTNSQGGLYVFDKKQNRISSKSRSPKSVFHEPDRNTVEIKDGITSSALEDLLYSKIDNDSSGVVKYFQLEEISKIELTTERRARFLFFLTTLFWRIPNTDKASEDVINRTEIQSSSIEPDILLNDPTYRKMLRAGLFKHQIDEMITCGSNKIKQEKIYEFEKDILVLGDNPILFKDIPKMFREFNDKDILMAISSRRIFSSTESVLTMRVENALRYNAYVIHQAPRYIACGNLEVLEQSVQLYREYIKLGIISFIPQMAFNSRIL